jgi:hypothetical protein
LPNTARIFRSVIEKIFNQASGTMLKRIANELRNHVPFTAAGAATGIIIMVIIVLGNVPASISNTAFYTLHPIHIILSAMVTTAIYRRYRRGKIWAAVLIGYAGSIGIATLSDAVIPYIGGALLNIEKMELHIPFLETGKFPVIGIAKWQLINSAAAIGIALGHWKQVTRFPHMGHVLLSTWASLFYFTAFGAADWIPLLGFVFLFLIIAVLLPCCLSDIVFPLLFVRKNQSPVDEAHLRDLSPGE